MKTLGFESAVLHPDQMADKHEIQVTPKISQLLTTKERVTCTQEGCSKTFVHDGALYMHLVKSHGVIKNDKDKSLFHGRKTETITTFHCPVELCQYSVGAKKHFTSYGHVKQHYLNVHAERNKTCEKCDTGFTTERKLQQHKERCGILYSCGTCTVKYTTKEALLTHCKRQEHVYPEEYAKKEKEKKKRTVQRAPQPSPSIVTIVTQPVILITAPPTDTNKPKTVREILCKPHIPEKISDTKSSLGDPKVINLKDEGHLLPRQDAFIQTDIYGVNTLALNKDIQQPRYNGTNSGAEIVVNTPKKFSNFKRRINCPGDQNASSPRRKKMKSSTGIQTAVSFTKKKGIPMVSSTQTTGDYIIETALRQANIHIEKKTVALQVTPQKQSRVAKVRPVLVDSFSQVKQQNIYAETSHNLAESQTMTDIPPSISTQTLQSYLVNQQELRNKKPGILDPHGPCSDTMNIPNPDLANRNKTPCTNNTLHIYNENLLAPVKYIMPDQVAEESQKLKSAEIEENLYTAPKTPEYSARELTSVELQNLNGLSPGMHANTDGAVGMLTRSNLPVDDHYLIQHHHTMDMEAQTMSATEFDMLLESSGIFLNKNEFLAHKSNVSPQTVSTCTQGSVTESQELANNLEFLSTATNTIDMNTQTADLNLFESLVPIDSNTQTGGPDFDFLDMVMTNMETQTLNDDDLVSLGLLDASLSSTVHSKGTGYSSKTGTQVNQDEITKVVLHSENQSKKTSTSTSSSTDVLTDLNLLGVENNNTSTGMNHSTSAITKSPVSKPTLLGSTEKVHVIETQTVSLDFCEPSMQTETQTQVESADTDFEMMNTETQTTFDDLQQLSDWFHH